MLISGTNSNRNLPRDGDYVLSIAPSEPFRQQDLADVMEYIEGRRPTTANQRLSLQTLINHTLRRVPGNPCADKPHRRGLSDGRLCPDQDIPLSFSMPTEQFHREAFERALRDTIHNTEILRAEFQLNSLEHYEIRRADEYVADVRTARADDEQGARQLMEEEFLRGFQVQFKKFERDASPLSGAHLPRVVRALIIEGPAKAHLLIIFHHLVFDGMSCRPFLAALGEAYRTYNGATKLDFAVEPDGHCDRGSAPPEYADFGRWQAILMLDEAFERTVDSWGKLLQVEERAGELPLLQLPALQEHSPCPPIETHGPREFPCDPSATFSISARQSTELRARYGANTEAQLLLGLYAVGLMRVTRQDAVVIGMPFDGRPDGYDHSIGYFANLLPILVEGHGRLCKEAEHAGGESQRFCQVLGQIKEQVCAAMEGCRHIPFQELVKRYRNRGTPEARKRTAIMQALFLYEDFFDWGDLACSFGLSSGSLQGVHFSKHRFAQLDVQLAVSRECGQDSGNGQSQCLRFHLSSDSLGQTDVEDLAAVLEQLLLSCCRTDSVTICPFRAELVPDTQKQDLLFTFQNQDKAFNTSVCKRIGRHETVVDMIAKIVEAHPRNEAVCFRGRRMTYSQLWYAARDVSRRVRARLEQLARKVRGDGSAQVAGAAVAFRSDMVGMAVERSAEQIVAVLGIMMAGCAYLPFYHNEPVERIKGVIRRHRVGVVVAVDRRFEDYHGDGELRPEDFIGNEELLLITSYEWDKDQHFIVPGVEAGAAVSDGEVKFPIPLRSDGLCYCLKTSGTTGEPKLVPVQHSVVTNRLLWMQHEFPLHMKDRFLRKAPIDFDVSVWEMLWPLVVGACVVVDAATKGVDFWELRRLIEREHVSCLHFVPTMFEAFLGKSKEANAQLDSIRGVFCSGEALKWDTVRRCRQQMRNAACVKNWYGPTEGGEVTSMECLADASLQQLSVYVPMGKPISNTRIVVLDENRSLVPIGTPGEVYIVGECLAAGYLDNAEQTCERFVEVERLGLVRSGTACIPDKDEGCSVVRAYRTGDLGSVRADGNILYLGRMDSQVKLRGVRVELGGIEATAMSATLGDEARMEHAACIVHNEQLALFYVVSTVRKPDEHYTEVEQFLKRKLPSTQQPHWICEMDEIPVTKTGKLNTARLVERIAQAEARSDEQAQDLSGNAIGAPDVSLLVTPRKAAPHERKIRRVLARELRMTEGEVDFNQNVRWMLDSMGMTRISGHLQFVRVVELMDMEVISLRVLVDLFVERQAEAANEQAHIIVGQKRSQLDSFDSLQCYSTPKKTRSCHMSAFSPTKLLFTPSTVDMTPSPARLDLSGFHKDEEGGGSESVEPQKPIKHENKDEEHTAVPTAVLNKMIACCREFERIMSEKD